LAPGGGGGGDSDDEASRPLQFRRATVAMLQRLSSISRVTGRTSTHAEEELGVPGPGGTATPTDAASVLAAGSPAGRAPSVATSTTASPPATVDGPWATVLPSSVVGRGRRATIRSVLPDLVPTAAGRTMANVVAPKSRRALPLSPSFAEDESDGES